MDLFIFFFLKQRWQWILYIYISFTRESIPMINNVVFALCLTSPFDRLSSSMRSGQEKENHFIFCGQFSQTVFLLLRVRESRKYLLFPFFFYMFNSTDSLDVFKPTTWGEHKNKHLNVHRCYIRFCLYSKDREIVQLLVGTSVINRHSKLEEKRKK